jgi:hypothetical protein
MFEGGLDIGTANEELVFWGPFVGPASGDQGRWVAKPITTVQLDFTGTVLEDPTTGGVVAGRLTLDVQPNGCSLKYCSAITIHP